MECPIELRAQVAAGAFGLLVFRGQQQEEVRLPSHNEVGRDV